MFPLKKIYLKKNIKRRMRGAKKSPEILSNLGLVLAMAILMILTVLTCHSFVLFCFVVLCFVVC